MHFSLACRPVNSRSSLPNSAHCATSACPVIRCDDDVYRNFCRPKWLVPRLAWCFMLGVSAHLIWLIWNERWDGNEKRAVGCIRTVFPCWSSESVECSVTTLRKVNSAHSVSRLDSGSSATSSLRASTLLVTLSSTTAHRITPIKLAACCRL